MKKYRGFTIAIIALALFSYYTISGNEKVGNVIWFYYLLIGVLTLITIPLVKSTKYATDRMKDKIPYSWVVSVLAIILSAMNGWFFIAFILTLSTGSLKLKEEIGKDELEKLDSPAG